MPSISLDIIETCGANTCLTKTLSQLSVRYSSNEDWIGFSVQKSMTIKKSKLFVLQQGLGEKFLRFCLQIFDSASRMCQNSVGEGVLAKGFTVNTICMYAISTYCYNAIY